MSNQISRGSKDSAINRQCRFNYLSLDMTVEDLILLIILLVLLAILVNKAVAICGGDEGKVHHLDIQNPPDCPTFDYLSDGRKTVEGRKYAPKYHDYEAGDTLIFHGPTLLKTKIVAIRRYATLEDYIAAEGLGVLPCAKSEREAPWFARRAGR